jgi:CYTH domain-containing protein
MSETPVEIERKYIIELPDISELSKMESYTASDIEQIYLSSSPAVTHRIRKRVYNDRSVYTETKKIRIDKISSYEDEHEISAEEYARLSLNIREGSTPLSKRRHTFSYLGQTFEIDVYPEWKGSSILETELDSRERGVEFPDFIKVVKEVSGIKEYSNSSMSMRFPDEVKI